MDIKGFIKFPVLTMEMLFYLYSRDRCLIFAYIFLFFLLKYRKILQITVNRDVIFIPISKLLIGLLDSSINGEQLFENYSSIIWWKNISNFSSYFFSLFFILFLFSSLFNETMYFYSYFTTSNPF